MGPEFGGLTILHMPFPFCGPLKSSLYFQWRIQEFQKGDAEQGVRSPAGSRGGAPVGSEPQWGRGAKPPETMYGHYATFTTHNKRKLQYKDIYNTTKTLQT